MAGQYGGGRVQEERAEEAEEYSTPLKSPPRTDAAAAAAATNTATSFFTPTAESDPVHSPDKEEQEEDLLDAEDELRMAKLRQTMAGRWNESYPDRKRELSARDREILRVRASDM